MHKHSGSRRSDTKYFTDADMDGGWEGLQSRRRRGKTGRIRHKPYERYSTPKLDWFEDADDDYYE